MWGMLHAWQRRENHTKFLSDNMKEREPLRDVVVDGSIMLCCSLMKYSLTGWAGINCLNVGSIGRLLCMW